jgi:hypothetical protein
VSHTPAAAKPSGRVATCAAIAKETKAFVTEAAKKAGSPVSVDKLLHMLAPLGTCVEPVVGGGAWALVLSGPPEIEAQEIVDPSEAYDEDGNETGKPGTPVAWTIVRDWVPTFVTADGKRLTLADPPPLPSFDMYLDENGNAVVPPWPHDDQSVDVSVESKANPDGTFSVSFSDFNGVALLRFDGKAVVVDPAQALLPNITGFKDFNKDGRVDLIDGETVEVHMYGDGNYVRPLDLVALALPDGSYTTRHPEVDAYYRAACEKHGRSPWILGQPSDSDAVVNIACARIFGVPVATIKAGLEREKATVTESDDFTTIPAFDLFQDPFDDLMEWLDRELPASVARTDGYRALEVASVKADSAMKAFGVYRFDAGEATDGDLGTSWQPKKGKNAWIELKLKGPETIVALDIANGLQRTDKLGDLFALNSRATKIAVAIGGKTFELTLDADKRGFQRLDLPEAVTGDTLRITIKGSAKGSRWAHLAISEIVVLGR